MKLVVWRFLDRVKHISKRYRKKYPFWGSVRPIKWEGLAPTAEYIRLALVEGVEDVALFQETVEFSPKELSPFLEPGVEANESRRGRLEFLQGRCSGRVSL